MNMGRISCALMATAIVGRRSVIASTVTLCTMFSAAGAFASESVRLNEVIRSIFYAPQYVAFEIGAFKDAGLNVNGPKTTWGSQATLTEIISGNSDIALLGPEAAILTREASEERRLYNFAQLTNGDGTFILSKEPIQNFKVGDLKGKTIVTSGRGSTSALALVQIIKQAGLNPEKDVTIRFIPISSNIIPSYLEANTSFAQAFEPAIYRAVEEKRGHRVAAVGPLLGEMPYTAYMASGKFIKENPAAIQSFTNAIQKGLGWTHAHSSKEIAALISKYFKEVSHEALEAVIDEYKKIGVWPKSTLITPEGMTRMSDLMLDGGVIKKGATYDEVVRPEFARKAEQSQK